MRIVKQGPVRVHGGLRHHLYSNGATTWLVVTDPCAGRLHVYTVYRISLTGDKETRVIGRELPLPDARRVVRQDMEVVR